MQLDPATAKACASRIKQCPSALRRAVPLGDTPRLSRWFRLPAVGADLARLRATPGVLRADHAPEAAPPPFEPSVTPDFTDLQVWRAAFPDGLGFDEGVRWPGGDGAGVRLADVEYGWDPAHEDLAAAPGASAWGFDTWQYGFHGTSVLGILIGTDNAFGVTGVVPGVEILGVSPFVDELTYDVAAAIAGAASLLAPGDVLLIEQQAYVAGTYGPVSYDAAAWDAIADAVDAGIVVIEPGGNGGLDLDDPAFEGVFDRLTHDHGGVLVGGGYPSTTRRGDPRGWTGGSSYGSRLDAQGWYSGIVTTTGDDDEGLWADLYFPDGDGHRAYTRSFGGTSGASPMVAAAAASVQSVRRARGFDVLTPRELRSAMRSAGTPSVGDSAIGAQPDVRRLLRDWGLR